MQKTKVSPWCTVAVTCMVVTACASRPVGPGDGTSEMAPGATEVMLETPDAQLYGTLLVPLSGRRVVAVIIPGSGPTDRDGNSPALPGPNNSLRMLAEGLAAEGIATLRVDKRGIAASANAVPNAAELRFDDYVQDAARWVGLLRQGGQFDRVYLIGHSEGGLVASMAAAQGGVDGVVIVAGAGFTMAETIRRQLSLQLPPNVMAQVDSAFAAVRRGAPVPELPGPLGNLFAPTARGYLRSVMDIDPVASLAAVEVPVLVVHGTTDIQVSGDDAARLAAASPRARLVLIEGMNHVLKRVDGPLPAQLPSYGDPTLPVVEELIDTLAAFLRR